MRLIDADALLEKFAELEATALDMCRRHMHDDDQAEWKRWSVILTERTAYRYDVLDAPTVDAVSVERDIPKAPTDKQLEEDGYGAWGSLYGRCPNCRESVYEEQNYCEKCGQRLDWGREERG